MTDSELLELAAKAAGYDYSKFGGYIVADGIPGNWNPLTNDGDALRLAVKLEMDIRPVKKIQTISVWTDSYGKWTSEFYAASGDPYAATRRAIVRAAAEIGKESK